MISAPPTITATDASVLLELSRRDGEGEYRLRASQMLDRQTFVFSATLTVPDNVRKKLKKRQAQLYGSDGGDNSGKGGDKKRAATTMTASGASTGTIGTLMEAVPFYGRVKLVALTDQSQTVAKRVMESSLECTEVGAFTHAH